MAEVDEAAPGLISLGKDAQQVAARYPRQITPATPDWESFPVEIPDGLGKLVDGHCGYGS